MINSNKNAKKIEDNILVIKPQYYDFIIFYRVIFVLLFVSSILYTLISNFILLALGVWYRHNLTFLLFIIFIMLYPILQLYVMKIIKKVYLVAEFRIGSNYIEIYGGIFGFKKKTKVLYKDIREVTITQGPFQAKKNLSTIKILTNAVTGSNQDSSLELLDIQDGDLIYDKIMQKVKEYS